MTARTYPTDIVTSEGWARIHQGHELDRDLLLADLASAQVPLQGDVLRVHEAHFAYKPRVKWCSNFDGYGCDQEGEWHGHWFEVKPGPDTAFTVVW